MNVRRRLLPAVLVLLAALPLPGATPAPLPELPARLRAPSDQAQFRRLVLPNGLKVLLVSDPKFNKSGAALMMPVGQIDDPAAREGMAHFLEHMLFLGTAKYPEPNAYGNFMQSNGGYSNAYTASDHTNYQFEVRHEALAEGLDRFAQFFIAPLFTAEFTGREINAVHNEAMRHVQNDSRRLFSVLREVYAPGSGESKFSTGNKDTLAGATPAEVRAFYEATYSADRMALAICGKAALDELERHARTLFADIPRRPVTPPRREPAFLPRKAALRVVQVEPVKEVRSLQLEFVVPATRPDFLSKPDELLTQLIGYPGPGGLVEALKRDGLINGLNAFVWERTADYGSLMIGADLTPAGLAAREQVTVRILAYLQHLRAAPFPADFYRDRARIAQLDESFRDRGEGAALATKLANQAGFYPLEVAERAGDVWGPPDEAAYRRLLNALTPDNLLVAVMAKGVPTDRAERIYQVKYSYTEDTGAGYQALLAAGGKDAFRLPGANAFLPGATNVLPERPVALVDEPGLRLFWAPDAEFQRPQVALSLRFVPVARLATPKAAALLRLFDACLRDHLEPASADAALAGIDLGLEASLEGWKLSVAGYGDSGLRYAAHVAGRLRDFSVTPARFEALKEATLRGLRSYVQSEAYILARNRRDALMREHFFLPPETLAATEAATWAEVQAFGREFFAQGAIEAVVHGHLAPEAAVTAVRDLARAIGATPAPEAALLRRRHVQLQAGENVVDAGPVEGVNSAFVRDYLLPDDTPEVRAAAAVLGNFFADPFFSELRTKQQLGYIVGGGAGGSLRHRYFAFVIQSSTHAPTELQRRAEAVIAGFPEAFAQLTDEQWKTLVAGARSGFEEKAKSIREKAELFFTRAFTFDGEWDRQQASLAALDRLTREQTLAFFRTALDPATARRRTVLLAAKEHRADLPAATFADREAWQATRQFR